MIARVLWRAASPIPVLRVVANNAPSSLTATVTGRASNAVITEAHVTGGNSDEAAAQALLDSSTRSR